ncbi:MAG: hypothetical protein JWN71_2336 [Xanthobacteraceae bacterium]|nr:hypothetical protein [Xanthobacteraceae bacterium]
MRKRLLAVAVMAASMAFSAVAQAGSPQILLTGQRDPAVAVSSLAVGAAATGSYFWLRHNYRHHNGALTPTAAYVGTSVACAALSPIVGTVIAQRPMTQREVWVMTGSCVVPIVGGLLMNAVFDAHPEWEAVPVKHRKRYSK